MINENQAFEFARDQGLKVLGDMLNLRPTEQANIVLQRSIIPIPDYNGLLFGFEMHVNGREILPTAILFVRVIGHEEDAFSVKSVKLRRSAENLVFEYVPRTAVFNMYDPDFVEPLRIAAMDQGSPVMFVLEEVVDKLKELDDQSRISWDLGSGTRDMSAVDVILKQRAELLIALPSRLERIDDQFALIVLPVARFVAGFAQDALDTDDRDKLNGLSLYYIGKGPNIGDPNVFEELLDVMKARVSEV